jgi:hypothetical protein
MRILIQGSGDQKFERFYKLKQKKLFFFKLKIGINLSLVFVKDVQAAGEASRFHKRKSSTS